MNRNNPDLPTYQCPAYLRQIGPWQFVDDVFQGPEAWFPRDASGKITVTSKSHTYLIPFYSETIRGGDAYLNRAKRSPFTGRYRQAILDFVGLLFSSGIMLEGVPDKILNDLHNIDGRGTTLQALLPQLAIAALRRGHTFVLVDVVNGGIRWKHYGANRLINWMWDDSLAVAYLKRSEVIPDGRYGQTTVDRVLQLMVGEWVLWEIGEEEDEPVVVREGEFGRTDGSAMKQLEEIPLICFHSGEHPLDQQEPFESSPPLYSLADLNISHYQVHSDHLHKIRKCCFPINVATGIDGDEDTLILGPDALVSLPHGSTFEVKEPKAESIAQSRLELDNLEKAMDFLSLQFLVNPSDRQAAQVSVVQVAKMESGLSLFASNFSAGITRALQMHGAYYGLAPEECGTAKIEANLFKQRGDNPQLLQAYSQAYRDLSELSKNNSELAGRLEEVLKRRGFIEDET